MELISCIIGMSPEDVFGYLADKDLAELSDAELIYCFGALQLYAPDALDTELYQMAGDRLEIRAMLHEIYKISRKRDGIVLEGWKSDFAGLRN